MPVFFGASLLLIRALFRGRRGKQFLGQPFGCLVYFPISPSFHSCFYSISHIENLPSLAAKSISSYYVRRQPFHVGTSVSGSCPNTIASNNTSQRVIPGDWRIRQTFPALLRGRLTEPGYPGTSGCRIFCQPDTQGGKCARQQTSLARHRYGPHCPCVVAQATRTSFIETEEDFKREFFWELRKNLVDFPYVIKAKRFELSHKKHDNIMWSGGYFGISEDGPILQMWRGSDGAKNTIRLFVDKDESLVKVSHRDGPYCKVQATPEKSLVKAQADIFVGKDGYNASLSATEHRARLIAIDRAGGYSFP